MTKAHKEIALFLVQLADKESVTETQIIREVAEKTQELLAHLRFVTVSLFGTKLLVAWKVFCYLLQFCIGQLKFSLRNI